MPFVFFSFYSDKHLQFFLLSPFYQDVPCGNTVALVGVDQFILKSGTITTLEDSCFVSFNLDGLVQVEGEQFLKGERIRHERLLKTVEGFFL